MDALFIEPRIRSVAALLPLCHDWLVTNTVT